MSSRVFRRTPFLPVVGLALASLVVLVPPASADSEIAALRRATAAFHDLEFAMSAGWTEDLTGCLESPDGGMGHHYANFDLLLDDVLDPLRPETLVYEPQRNGRMRLVAVEWVIPEAFLPSDADPPVLFGQELHFNPAVPGWVLHVWLWRHNPAGMFADWNPRVSCEFAD